VPDSVPWTKNPPATQDRPTTTNRRAATPSITVERVQTGVRTEKRILKVLKGLAEYHDLTLGDLLEGIVLHAFEGKCALASENLRIVADLRRLYHLDLDASASHRLIERA
jgi:predicted DNA-binding ribbon-helix-helix protein